MEAREHGQGLDINEALKRLRAQFGDEFYHTRRREVTNMLLTESVRADVPAQLPIV
ncbi:hypothetical protein [Propylenella binzhouense]|uniref:hypothetical protein n=1 Tax=Propylenella binzhouense TaxID=2555902 RepID=UPI0013722CE2|nr:hypothetical protein [Propylenella binzhouense]